MAYIGSQVITKLSDYDFLINIIEPSHIDDDVLRMLKKYIGLNCKQIIIDYPYYDSDYLSTYYIFYAKKFRNYDKKCYRLILLSEDERLIGFVTLRPTHEGSKFGKSYLNPNALISGHAHIMLEKFKLHYNGDEYLIQAFPWMQQESDVAICAHTALWSLIRYAKKFRQYPVLSMSEIIDKVECDTRKIPSLGLTVTQVSNVLLKCGFSPIIRNKTMNDGSSSLLNECLTYIDSGIPIIGTMDTLDHAVVIVGYYDVDRKEINEATISKGLCKRILRNGDLVDTDIILHTELIRSIIVNDDNFFPYKKVRKVPPLYVNPSEVASEESYLAESIDHAIIPLYSRTQLVYNDVISNFVGLNAMKIMDWPSPKVVRIYMTSASTYKEYMKKVLISSPSNKDLCDFIFTLELPRFIWCIEVAGFSSYKNKLIDGIAVIDPTCSTQDSFPFIFMHDLCNFVYEKRHNNSTKFKKSKDNCYPMKIEPYSCFDGNLTPIVK